MARREAGRQARQMQTCSPQARVKPQCTYTQLAQEGRWVSTPRLPWHKSGRQTQFTTRKSNRVPQETPFHTVSGRPFHGLAHVHQNGKRPPSPSPRDRRGRVPCGFGQQDGSRVTELCGTSPRLSPAPGAASAPSRTRRGQCGGYVARAHNSHLCVFAVTSRRKLRKGRSLSGKADFGACWRIRTPRGNTYPLKSSSTSRLVKATLR